MSREVTAEDRDESKKFIREIVKRSFEPGAFIVEPPEGFPETIAGAPTGNLLKDFQRKMGRAVCNRWARGDRPEILPHREVYYRELCGLYLGGGLPGQPSLGPPFTGGQCDKLYNVEGTGEFLTTNSTGVPVAPYTTWTTANWTTARTATAPRGPIRGIQFDLWVSPWNFVRLGCNVAGTPTSIDVYPVGGPATPTYQDNSNKVRGAGTRWGRNLRITSVVVRDGSPDNCGSLPDEYDQGDRNPTADPAPGPIGTTIGLPFPNFDIDISPSGEITIDFGDGSGDEDFDPTDFSGGANDGPGTPPGDIGSPGAAEDTGAGDEADGEAPDGSILVGLKIAILATPPTAREFSDGIFRGAGYVYMGVPDNLGLYPDAANLQNGQFIFANRDNLTAWKVSSNSGYNLRVTPFYREAE